MEFSESDQNEFLEKLTKALLLRNPFLHDNPKPGVLKPIPPLVIPFPSLAAHYIE